MAQNALKNNVVHPKTHCKKDQCVQLIGTTVHSACNREPFYENGIEKNVDGLEANQLKILL